LERSAVLLPFSLSIYSCS